MPKTTLLVATVLLALSSQAAIPPKSVQANQEAYDVLLLPEINQRQVALKKSETLYPALIRISRQETESMPMRWKALTLASSLKPDQALPELEIALKSPNWFMRNAALLSLAQYHPERGQKAAQALLKDKALVVRSAAVQVLGKNLNAGNRDLLWENLNAPENFRRQQSLWIRGEILSMLAAKPEARETALFVKSLNDKDPKIQASAVVAMERLTKSVLGTKNMAVAEKKELWVKWAKARPSGTL